MKDIKTHEINNFNAVNFDGEILRYVKTNDGNTYFLVTDVCNILGVSNKQTLFNSADKRTKAQATLPIGEGKNPQRFNLVDIDGLQYIVYRSRVSLVNRLDFVKFCKNI